MFRKKLMSSGTWLKKSVWAFPLVLLIILILLTAFKISGSSVGQYYHVFYGSSTKDPNLLLNKPRPIRSDEWLATTQETIAQAKTGFPANTQNYGDTALATDIPAKDWSTIFKPQLWGFFFLPLENAFALKWWSFMFLLMVGCYFFVLRLLPGKRLFAALISVAFGLSPFELWWYQSPGFLPIAYSFFMLILLMRIMGREPVKWVKDQRLSDVIYALAFVFLMGCFGLIMYPPFQIPIAIVLLFFGLGYLANVWLSGQYKNFRSFARRVGIIVGCLVAAGIIGLLFYYDNRQAIHALNGTVYPGHRVNGSGGMGTLQMMDSFVMPAEQSDFRGAHFFANQSEAANFILLLPFTLLPGFLVMWSEWKKRRQVDWVMFALQVLGVLLFIRAFTPYGNAFFKLLLLNRVPNNGRLIIGFGFLGIVQLVYLVKKLNELRLNKQRLLNYSFLYGISCFIVLLWTGWFIKTNYPLFIHEWWVIIGLAGLFTATIVAFLANRRIGGASLLLLFTLISSYQIMPLYRGLGILTNTPVVQQMAEVSKPGDTWVAVGDDSLYFEDFGWLAGRPSLSGVHSLDNSLWSQVGGPQYEYVYNRIGHAFFTDNPAMIKPIVLMQSDAFWVKFQCDGFIEKNARFALSLHPMDLPCVSLEKTVTYPVLNFYLYRTN